MPTMGYFHRGHLSLMEYGKTISEKLVVSLFVNPAQFGPEEDLDRYPRDLERDAALAREVGVDLPLHPRGRGHVSPGLPDLCGGGAAQPEVVRRLPAGAFPGGGHRGAETL